MERTVTVKRSDRAVFRKLDAEGGGVLLHLDAAPYHRVNEVGALVWELLDDEPTVQRLTSAVQSRFREEPAHRVAAGVEQFVRELAERRLVELADDR